MKNKKNFITQKKYTYMNSICGFPFKYSQKNDKVNTCKELLKKYFDEMVTRLGTFGYEIKECQVHPEEWDGYMHKPFIVYGNNGFEKGFNNWLSKFNEYGRNQLVTAVFFRCNLKPIKGMSPKNIPPNRIESPWGAVVDKNVYNKNGIYLYTTTVPEEPKIEKKHKKKRHKLSKDIFLQNNIDIKK